MRLSKPPRPKPLPVKFDSIPHELKDREQWVLWKYVWKEGKNGKQGKWDKPPFALKGNYASSTNPQTWCSFEEVRTAYEQGLSLPEDHNNHYDGLGFVPNRGTNSNEHLTFFDLDKCRNAENGKIEEWAIKELKLINSYSEISPSGTGIRIIAKGLEFSDQRNGRKSGHIEIYQEAHYLTITGERLKEFPSSIEIRSKEIELFYKRHFDSPEQQEAERGCKNNQSGTKRDLTDNQIIELASRAANGASFKRLMGGNDSGYKSQSEADAALCSILAFYTRNEAQIERIWGQSGLARREKFQRIDYRERTIRNALRLVKDTYKGNSSQDNSLPCKVGKKKSIADRLVELAHNKDCELWHTPEGEAYISFLLEGHKENHPLNNKSVESWLGMILYREEGKAAGKQAITDAINILMAQANFEGPEYPVFIRVGKHNGSIYIDLCDEKWRAVEVTDKGWKIIDQPPVRFKRSRGMLPLPEPVRGGSIEELRSVLNINDTRKWTLLKGILAGALNPNGPYPVAIFGGEQGSAKSTTQKILKNLIDPNKGALKRPPKDERDLMIAATNSWIISFDNLSGIPHNLSDALCVLSTGGTLSTRELYTDAEEVLLSARRPLFLNGIDSIPSRHDLLDRAIIITLPSLREDQRKTESEIMAEFKRIHPGILGALLDAVSLGLKNVQTTKLTRLPRMADFAVWVTACEEGLECEPGSFMKAYMRAIDESTLDSINSDPLAQTIIRISEIYRPSWSGTPSRLLEEINILSGYNHSRPPYGWPKTASTLSNKLNRLAPSLRKVGVEIRSDRTSDARKITIGRVNDAMTAMTANFKRAVMKKNENRRH